jgi:hypothetical protein
MLLAGITASVPGAEDSLFGRIKQHFEWGEYDSISKKLAPLAPLFQNVRTDDHQADLRAYYGVALFAQGKIGEARSQFLSAFRADSSVSIDRRYVSEEIYDLFRATRTDFRRQSAEKAQQDSISQKQQSEQVNQSRIERMQKQYRLYFGVSLVSFAVGAACGALSWREWRIADAAYADFQTTRLAGDQRNYDKYRTLVDRTDRYTIAGIAGTVLCCAGSGILLRNAIVLRGRALACAVTWNPANGGGIAVSSRW